MSNFNHSHLNLILNIKGRKKKKKPPISVNSVTNTNKINRKDHVSSLKSNITGVKEYWDNLGISENIPLLLKIDPEKYDINFLRTAFEFEILAQEKDGYVIVVSEDINLSQLENKIHKFLGNIRGGSNVAYLHEIESEDERLKKIMGDELFKIYNNIQDDELIIIDCSIACEGKEGQPKRGKNDTDEIYKKKVNHWEQEIHRLEIEREDSIEDFVIEYKGEILDNVLIGLGSFVIRLRINGQGFKDLVKNFRFTFKISLPEDIGSKDNSIGNIINNNLPNLIPPEINSPIIGIIDSGIQEAHPYLELAIKSGFSYSYIPDDELNYSDEVRGGGHGTKVAGAILYGNNIPKSGTFNIPFWLANIRVLDKDSILPKELLPPALIEDIVDKYKNKIKIFNHSINAFNISLDNYMPAWAGKIDDLSHDNDIIIVQSIGNITDFDIEFFIKKDGLDCYPGYLNSNILCSITPPAQSMHSLTVGSVCIDSLNENGFLSIGEKDTISPFSRVGPGMWTSIKPDLVEYGGSYMVDSDGNISPKKELCPELICKSPPLYNNDICGTSFSTPKVTNILSHIQKNFPDESCLLYRALIVNSAKWPIWAETLAIEDKKNIPTILSQIGYGIADLDKSLYSSDYRVTFFTPKDISIAPDSSHFYQINIPDILLNKGYQIKIEVSLSYKAKPRITRLGKNGYLSTRIDWTSSNIGENLNSFQGRIFDRDNSGLKVKGYNIPWMIGNDGRSSSGMGRNAGTIQKDWCVISSENMHNSFYIGVTGHNGWDSTGKYQATYSLVISFEVINEDIEIYNEFEVINEIQTQIEEHVEISGI